MKNKMSVEEFLAEFARQSQTSESQAYAYAKEIGESKTLLSPQTRQCALCRYAIGLFYNARYEEAEKILKSFAFDYEKYPFKSFYVDALSVLGLIQYYKQRYHLSIFYAGQAVSLAQEKKCSDRLAGLYSNLAAPYRELGENARSLAYLDRSLQYASASLEPSVKASLLYNRTGILMSLERYGEARETILQVEEMAKALPIAPIFVEFLPLSKAEIALALHESVDLSTMARSFLQGPYQDDPDFMSYVLADDQSLFDLLKKYGYRDDALLCLDRIKKIQAQVPSLTTAIFIAKNDVEFALEKGDELAAGKAYGELARLYQKQNEGYAEDFDEITKLHFDFVRMTSAYQKAQKRARKLLEESDTDALTLLPNRRALEKEKKHFSLWAKKDDYFALALLDYDHFKEINDGYGYQAGDAALRLGGELFKSYASTSFHAFRYGGDEYLFLLAGKSPKEVASFFAKIQTGLAAIKLKTNTGERIPLSCCIGYSLYHGDYEGYSAAFRLATEAVHQAKKLGRGQMVALSGETKAL
jgi:diguanylate cyclase (GGDEF)-like protein